MRLRAIIPACLFACECGGSIYLSSNDAATSDGAVPMAANQGDGPTGSSQDAASGACDLPAAEVQSLLARWNKAATAAATAIDFHWTVCQQFPHPTFKGGTAEAYGQFATVLLQFFQQGDDFAFLAGNHLFGVSLTYVFPSGMLGLNTTFKELASYFSSPSTLGSQSTATRQALASYLAQIP